jgi:sulfotransferase
MAQKIFYQSSLPRSGSTLLQNILAQNPDFYVTPSSGLVKLVTGAQSNYGTVSEIKAQDPALMRKGFAAFCRGGVEHYCQALTDKPYFMDKSRSWSINYDLLKLIFEEDPKIICMVRDLRQILSSWEKLFRENRDKYPASESATAGPYLTTFMRMIAQLKPPAQPIGIAMERLFEILHQGWDKKMLLLRYEDLTAHPEETMGKVYQYLGVPPFKHHFDVVAQTTQEDDRVYGRTGLHDIRPKVESTQNDYLQILGRDSVNYLQTNYAWYFKRFGYHPVGGA